MSLHRLTAGDPSAPDLALVLDDDAADDAGAPVVTLAGSDGVLVQVESADHAIVHVIEPVLVDPARLDIPLDALSDVDAPTPADGALLVLAYDATAHTYRLVESPAAALDPDLAAIAALDPADGAVLHRVGGAWAAGLLTRAAVMPSVVVLPDTLAGGTVAVDAADAASLYRVSVSGPTAILSAPAHPGDGDVVNVELYAATPTELAFDPAIVRTGGLDATVDVPAGALWCGALRYRGAAPPAPAWRLLASSVDGG